MNYTSGCTAVSSDRGLPFQNEVQDTNKLHLSGEAKTQAQEVKPETMEAINNGRAGSEQLCYREKTPVPLPIALPTSGWGAEAALELSTIRLVTRQSYPLCDPNRNSVVHSLGLSWVSYRG